MTCKSGLEYENRLGDQSMVRKKEKLLPILNIVYFAQSFLNDLQVSLMGPGSAPPCWPNYQCSRVASNFRPMLNSDDGWWHELWIGAPSGNADGKGKKSVNEVNQRENGAKSRVPICCKYDRKLPGEVTLNVYLQGLVYEKAMQHFWLRAIKALVQSLRRTGMHENLLKNVLRSM